MTSRFARQLGRLPLLLIALAIATAGMGAMLLAGRPATVLASPVGNTGCHQSSLQTALDNAPRGMPYTITFTPGCTINLGSSLGVGSNVNITIDGNGLVLQAGGGYLSPDLIVFNDGGGASTLTLNGVTLQDGLHGINDQNLISTVNLNDSTVSGNWEAGVVAGSANIVTSTINGNGGAGLYAGSATVTDSTIYDNSSSGLYTTGHISVTSSTITNNGAGNKYGVNAGSMTLTATILSGNNGGNCSTTAGDSGYNLSTDISCGFGLGTTSKNNVAGLDLQGLADNGGPTETEAIDSGSTAFNEIPAVNGVCSVGAKVDQRGVSRPQGGGCDVGAYELIQGATTLTSGICPTQALLQGDINLSSQTGGQQLTIDLPANCTIDLTSPLTIASGVDITIDGNGLTLVGANSSTDVIDINGLGSLSTLSLNQVTVEGGAIGINNQNYLTSTVNLTGSTVSSNASEGISVATATITNSTVSGNAVVGINAATITLTSSTVSGNAGNGIGGTYVTVANSTISGNTGAGIFADNVTVTNSTVSGNHLGILASDSATLTATILANTSPNCAGTDFYDDGGYNLSTDRSCGFTSSTSLPNGTVTTPPTDQQLNLLPLGNYGGPTQTQALGPASIAIDAVDAILTGPDNDQPVCLNAFLEPILYPGTTTPITTDQRGIARSQGAKCDIGAYEAPALSLGISPSAPNGSNGWYVTDPTLTLGYGGLAVGQDSTGGAQAQVASCTGLSGLAHTASTLNDSGSVDASVSSDGSYAISCGVKQGTTSLGVSYSGPDSNAVPFDLNVDTTPPTTTASYSNSYTPGTWTNQAVTVTLNASDNEGGSGVATTYYAIDNSSCTATTAGLASCSVYTTPFTISANGTHTLTFFSVDAAGNIEAAQSATIKIDTVAPTAQPEVSGTNGNNGWYIGPVTITWNWTDNPGGSGIDTSNCTTSSSYSGPDSATASVSADCYDLAGNKGTASTSFKYDATPPDVQCTSPDTSVWYDHNVSVSCTAGDPTSGLANTNLSSFSLTTTVGPDSANGSASTPSQQVCDQAGNCVTAGPYTFMVDLAPPTITTPVANGTYTVNESVPLTCADVGSGVNSCQVTVKQPDGTTTTVAMPNDIPTGQPGTYTVTPNTVTDIAGNADTTSFSYTVDYAMTSLPGSTTTVTQGYYAIIRFDPSDANGHDEASRGLAVTSVELDGPNNQVIPFAYAFQYGTFSGKAGYQLSLNTRNLAPGSWTLVIQIGTGKSAATGTITFAVE